MASRGLLHAAWGLLWLVACGPGPAAHQRVAVGGKHYGGVFNANESEPIRSIYPPSLSQASATRIASLVYQGLVRLDPHDLSIKPCLAESWDTSADLLTYTFHLRSGVRFHDDPCFPEGVGRALTARDVVERFTDLCTPGPQNQMFWLFQDRIAGASAYYSAMLQGARPGGGVSGFEFVDDRTLRIHLEHATPNILQILAHQGCWIFPSEMRTAYAYDLDRHAIGTGPFRVKAVHPGEMMVLERNPAYWEQDENGNQLPFLDAVRVTFEPDKEREFSEFLRGHLTVAYEVPVDRVAELGDSIGPDGHARFRVRSTPGLTTQFYGFNAFEPPFQDVRVRRAFCMAMDRRALTDTVLRGLAVPAERGLVPPGLPDYPYDVVEGNTYDPEQARALLAAAGYPDGEGFPPLTLKVNADGFGYVHVAEAIQDMLEKVLHVSVALSVIPTTPYYEGIERGNAQFWREGWVADYPDPENFLALLYGKNAATDSLQRSFLNNTRYRNVRFDSLFVAAQRMTDPQLRGRMLALAEKQAIRDAVVMPLYHDRNMRVDQPWVRDLPINGMEYRDLARVWFDKSTD